MTAKTYTELRDFLDRYTDASGVIQGDPATIAAEAVGAGMVEADDQHAIQFADENENKNENIAYMRAIVNDSPENNRDGLIAWAYDAKPEAVSFVLAQPIDVENGDGRSEWTWLRLANGDLCLAVFPHGETYMEVSEGALAPDVSYPATERA